MYIALAGNNMYIALAGNGIFLDVYYNKSSDAHMIGA